MAKRKKEGDSKDSLGDQSGAEDNFGLPDIDYKPLDTPADEAPVEPPSVEESITEEATAEPSQQEPEPVKKETQYVYEGNSEKSNAPLIISIIIALVVAVSGFLIYQYVYKPKADKETKERLAKEAEAKRLQKEAAEAKAREEEERKRREAEEAANVKPAEGTIETLTGRTGRYYVVVASSVDGDLVMDYAKKLSAKGTSSKIIPPFGKWKFYRLTISDHDTFSIAQTSADGSKTEYGPATWVIKY